MFWKSSIERKIKEKNKQKQFTTITAIDENVIVGLKK